jgi:hypothetical protein
MMRKYLMTLMTFLVLGVYMINDGNTATFRCVVGAEVWILTIHVPLRRVLQLMDTCLQIITDGCDKKINEHKYIEMPNEIDLQKTMAMIGREEEINVPASESRTDVEPFNYRQ